MQQDAISREAVLKLYFMSKEVLLPCLMTTVELKDKWEVKNKWPHFSISNNKMSSICKVLPSPFYRGEKHTLLTHMAECSLTGTIGSIVGSGKEKPGRPLGVWLLSVCMCLCVGIWGIIALHAQSCHRFSGNRVWKRWKSSDTHMHGKHTHSNTASLSHWAICWPQPQCSYLCQSTTRGDVPQMQTIPLIPKEKFIHIYTWTIKTVNMQKCKWTDDIH